jgi:hypothetical protein
MLHLHKRYFFSSSLTLEGVRRALKKDLGLETYSLDAHKNFINQCVDKVCSVVYRAIILKVLQWFFYTYIFTYSLVGFSIFYKEGDTKNCSLCILVTDLSNSVANKIKIFILFGKQENMLTKSVAGLYTIIQSIQFLEQFLYGTSWI